MANELRRVRVGESAYLKLNDADYKAWKAAGNKEYGEADAPADQEADAQPEVVKAEVAPAENKARAAAPEKKAR